MTRARSPRRRPNAEPLPGWALLVLGLALGAAAVLLTQLVLSRAGASDGLAALFARRSPPATEAPPKREPAPIRPKFDFYTVLPEIETVLPERGGAEKAAKPERPSGPVRYVLQAGSFASFADADQLKARLALQGLQARIQKVTIEGKGEYHRVRLGPYESLEELDAVNRELARLGIKALRLRVKGDAG
ncbi:MAG TPA: SPOR domain-containing protein [Burkholderiales bacterium]